MTPYNGQGAETFFGEMENIIPFPGSHSGEQYTTKQMSALYIANTEIGSQPSLRHKRQETQFYESFLPSISKKSKQILEEAFDRITDVADTTLTGSERSNCFDDWHDLLGLLVRSEENFTRHHRRVLGTLLSASNKKDVSDFNPAALKVFRDITNLLRQPRIAKADSQRAIRDILKTKTNVLLPLNAENICEEAVDEMFLNLFSNNK
ncbi:MAG: hypothetical protein EHM12_13250 [Dehalococcoidia bacterium]|nr:MAG: hypothetical protein EHM12_13250 [Dehalococcoidia bacterium]